MDISGNYLVTTGYSFRGATLIPDPLIKIFDLRTKKFLPPIPCSVGPTFARFHPNYAAHLLTGSREGALQINDINDSSHSKSAFLQASVVGYMTGMEFSPSGEVIGLADSFGGVQLWTHRPNPRFNSVAATVEYRDLVFEKSVGVGEDT